MTAPDLIVTNARVLTMDPDRPRAEAVAVAGGEIAALGSRGAVEALAGAGTRLVDARGASLLPGFVESHLHLFLGATELTQLQLAGVQGYDALERAVRAYAGANPDLPLVVAQGVRYSVLSEVVGVTRHDLDRILPDRPFAMAGGDHHTVWANTAALEAAGLLRGRRVGPGNEVVMGADGLATGELRESEAFAPVMALGGDVRASLGLRTGGEPDPAPTPAERARDRETLKRGLAHLARHGITSAVNMDGNRYTLELLSEIEAGGELTARVKVPFHFKTFMEIGALKKASEMAQDWDGPRLSSGFVKLFMDGVIDSGTAVLLEDYADRPGWRGEPLFEAARFAEIAIEADRRGLQIAVHAIGDGAVRTVLDGYQAARVVNGARDSRHRVEHIELVHPEDVGRFAALGVIASMQPPHPPGSMGLPLEPTLGKIGRRRWPMAYAWATLAAAGARLAFASDWPVSEIAPLQGISAALVRQPWAEGLPDQRIGREAVLRAYTSDGAYAAFAEDRVGRIAEGMAADLVLLDGDIEATGAAEIAAMRVAMTVMDGRVVHEG